MKKIVIISIFLCAFAFYSCQKDKISYLIIKDIAYPNPELIVVKGLEKADTVAPYNPSLPPFMQGGPSKYKIRIKNNAPWVAPAFWGASVEGARPLTVTIESVETQGEGADVAILKQEVKIIAEGRIEIPLDNKIPLGTYILSLRITNVNRSDVAPKVFKIIVTDKKW